MRWILVMTFVTACQGTRAPARAPGDGPRCDRRDNDCEPQPYAKATYWPDKNRTPVHDTYAEFQKLEGGTCSHDADCAKAGCGNHCVSATEQQFEATCEAYTALEPALCGCVERRCAWFVQ